MRPPPGVIRYLSEVSGVVPWTWWPHDETGHTDEAKKEIREYLGHSGVFDTPKPTRLINRMLEIAINDGDLVLDFFAGSSASAHAAMKFSAATGKTCKFIMVQLPEHCPPDTDAAKAGFGTVAEIGKERIRRAAMRITKEREDKLDLEGGGSLDLGFKVFKLDRSNFKIWDGDSGASDDLAEQLEMHVDHVSEASGPEDILCELLLKAGFPLTTTVETIELAGKSVFSIEDGALLICLEKEITPELIDAMADANPLQVICLDEGFKGNDQLKANAVQTFKARAENQESEIVFKTV